MSCIHKTRVTACTFIVIQARSDKRGFDLISDALPYSPQWYRGPNAIRDAIDYAKFYNRSHRAVIRVYNEGGDVIETHEHAGEFKEWRPDSGSIAPLKVRPSSSQPEEWDRRRCRHKNCCSGSRSLFDGCSRCKANNPVCRCH
jgi:hypothetical protein